VSTPLTPDEYTSHDGLGLAQLLREGRVTASELLEAALAKLEAINPTINAVVIPMLEEARTSVAAGLPDGPFRGVPFLLKDLATLYTGTRTTNGCRFFADHVADHDSELVTRYKAAGLVTFGKSASPEFGLTTTTESKLFGQTRNPWKLTHTAGGSSGGAAAAVAAGILPLAHASDGGGSIRIPASCCGLFGLKPTRGRMPFGPDAGEGWSGMSTMHAVTRTVRDSAALLDASHGPSLGAPYSAPPVEVPFLDEVGRDPGRLRIALQTRSFNGSETDPDCVRATREAADLCSVLGHEVEEACLEIDFPTLGPATQTIMASHLICQLEDRAAQLGRELGEEDIELFTRLMVDSVRERSSTDYVRAIRAIHEVGRRVDSFLQDLDLILTPTMATPPLELGALSLSNPDIQAFALNAMRT